MYMYIYIYIYSYTLMDKIRLCRTIYPLNTSLSINIAIKNPQTQPATMKKMDELLVLARDGW